MEQFYPVDLWPNAKVPKPSFLRRLWCRWTGGHQWAPFVWTNPANNHDYCEKCWLFRHEETTCPCREIAEERVAVRE